MNIYKWHSVKNELPIEYETVLACDKFDVYIGYFKKSICGESFYFTGTNINNLEEFNVVPVIKWTECPVLSKEVD